MKYEKRTDVFSGQAFFASTCIIFYWNLLTLTFTLILCFTLIKLDYALDPNLIIGQALSFKLSNIRIISVGMKFRYEIRIKKFSIEEGFKFSYKNRDRLKFFNQNYNL